MTLLYTTANPHPHPLPHPHPQPHPSASASASPSPSPSPTPSPSPSPLPSPITPVIQSSQSERAGSAHSLRQSELTDVSLFRWSHRGVEGSGQGQGQGQGLRQASAGGFTEAWRLGGGGLEARGWRARGLTASCVISDARTQGFGQQASRHAAAVRRWWLAQLLLRWRRWSTSHAQAEARQHASRSATCRPRLLRYGRC